jgi:hypothetical protein
LTVKTKEVEIPFDPEVAPQMCGPFSIASRGDLGTKAVLEVQQMPVSLAA